MKNQIILSSNVLLNALRTIKPAITKSSIFAPIECVLFDCKKSEITLTTTNLEMYAIAKIQGEGLSDFMALIPFTQLFKLVENLPIRSMYFSFDETNEICSINCNGAVFEINTYKSDDFPKTPELGDILAKKELTKRLIEDCTTALQFVSTDTLRPAMTGIYFDYFGKQLKIVATDAHALFVSDIYDGESERSYIIPANCLKTILGIAKKTSGTIHFSESHCNFYNEDSTFIIRLIDAPFPKYDAIVPLDKKYFSISTQSLISTLKSMLPFTQEVTRLIHFELNGNLKIEAPNINSGTTAKKELDYIFKNTSNFYFAFNGNLIIKMLSQINSNTVRFINDGNPDRCFILKGVDSNNTILLMPSKIIA